VCDKCGKEVISDDSRDVPDGWCLIFGFFFCSTCFSGLRGLVAPTSDKVQAHLGSMLDACSDDDAKRRISTAMTRDVLDEIWRMLPRPKEK